MANRDNPHGFIPRYHLAGGEIRTEEATATSSNAAFGAGAPLKQVNDGTLDKAAGGDVIVAIAAHSLAANKGGKISVYRDPNIVFSAQTDNGSGTATAQTAVNLNIDFLAGGVGSNGRSTAELDESSAATTATLPFKIRGLLEQVDNDFGEFNQLLVSLNNHIDKGGTGTAGV